VLLTSWVLGVSQPNLKVFLNVSAIVVGVVIASIGEVKFVLIGFLFQLGGIFFEALRLTMVQRLLSSSEFKMDPLVSLYYFAPVCAVMNGVVALIWEVPKISMSEVYDVGLFTFFLNGLCAFLLNVSVVFLVRPPQPPSPLSLGRAALTYGEQIGKTSAVVLTLCGVLKDIMLVGASMAIWGTHVSGLQFFGYSIALCGMVYYKLGYESLKGYISEAGRQWAEFGATRPALRKLVIIVCAVLIIFVLLGGLAPTYGGVDASRYLNEAANKVGLTSV
jgi:hypothetical protein